MNWKDFVKENWPGWVGIVIGGLFASWWIARDIRQMLQ